MAKRMRIVSWVVQPQVLSDDGEHLYPVQAEPLVIPDHQWEGWVSGEWRISLEGLRAQVEGPPQVPQQEAAPD